MLIIAAAAAITVGATACLQNESANPLQLQQLLLVYILIRELLLQLLLYKRIRESLQLQLLLVYETNSLQQLLLIYKTSPLQY